MNSKETAKGIVIGVLTLAAIALVTYLFWLASAVFVYIIVSFIIALIGQPVVYLLHKKLKLPSSISAAISILFFVGLIFGFFSLAIPMILKQAENLSLLNNVELQKKIALQRISIDSYLRQNNITVFDGYAKLNIQSLINFKKIPYYINMVLSSLGSTLMHIFSILFISFFFLKDSSIIYTMIFSIVPDQMEGRFSTVIEQIKKLLTRYFVGLLVQVFIMFILYLSILGLFSIHDIFIIAFICAFCNLIPFVGPLIGLVIFSLLSFNNMFGQGLDFTQIIVPQMIWLIFCYFLAQLVDNFLIQPFIYSNSVKSHPLEIFIVIIIAEILFGVVGVIAAVPAYTVLRVILKEFFSSFKVVQSITKNI